MLKSFFSKSLNKTPLAQQEDCDKNNMVDAIKYDLYVLSERDISYNHQHSPNEYYKIEEIYIPSIQCCYNKEAIFKSNKPRYMSISSTELQQCPSHIKYRIKSTARWRNFGDKPLYTKIQLPKEHIDVLIEYFRKQQDLINKRVEEIAPIMRPYLSIKSLTPTVEEYLDKGEDIDMAPPHCVIS